ncbi:4367_t:CDS:1, partial [Acaulospora morrowiae]
PLIIGEKAKVKLETIQNTTKNWEEVEAYRHRMDYKQQSNKKES